MILTNLGEAFADSIHLGSSTRKQNKSPETHATNFQEHSFVAFEQRKEAK